MFNKISKLIHHYFTNQLFNIWLCLIALTLISASFAETNVTLAIPTISICLIVMLKGRWIIDEFMGLKDAAPLIRKILKGYIYGMAALVGLTIYFLHKV